MSRVITNPKVGEKVVRGPNWCWMDQDKGSVYGVIKDSTYLSGTSLDKWVSVLWVDKDGNDLLQYSYNYVDMQIQYYEETETYTTTLNFLRKAMDAAGPSWKKTIADILRANSVDNILSGKAEVGKDIVEKSLSDASICGNWKDIIKKEFDIKEIESKWFKFGIVINVSTVKDRTSPMIIGNGYTPGEEGECLLIDKNEFEMVVSDHECVGGSYYKIKFKKK